MSRWKEGEWKMPEIREGQLNKYNWLVQHVDNFKLAKNTDIGAFTYINAKAGVTIEEGVQIGSHCSLYSVSTIDNKEGPIILKKGCSLGSHSTVMPGVTLGENSIVGAHSLVLESIPNNLIAYGVPAKVVKER